MAYYRLYFLNSLGHILHAVDWECENDASALALAGQHADGRAMELWCGDHPVASFAAAEAKADVKLAPMPSAAHGDQSDQTPARTLAIRRSWTT